MTSILIIIAKEMTSRAHMQKGAKQELQEKLRGGRSGRTEPKRAQAGRTSPFRVRFAPPLT
jgi:hypothetical protein